MSLRLTPFRFMLIVAISSVLLKNAGADWPNFRGPNHDGISLETGLKTDWKKPIPILWEREIGSAFSSFAAVGNLIYTCGTKDGQQLLLAMNAANGQVVWETPIEPTFRDSYGNGTRATPTVSMGKVYIQGAHGRLLCVNAASGKEIWSRRFSNMPTWGYSGSVLIEDNLAIVSPGNKDGSLAAYDKVTGQLVWQCGDDQAGYATPYPFTMNGKRYVVGFTGKSATIAEVNTGNQVLRIPWPTSYAVNAASPIFHDGLLLITSGYTTGCAVMELIVDSNHLTAKTRWRSKVLLNKFQSCLLHNGYLYTSDQKAMKCVEFTTGKEQWNLPRKKHGTMLIAGEHLFALSQEGELQIAVASADGFSPTTTAKILGGRCWSVPILHRGKLYARNMTRMVCFNLKP